MYDKVCHSVLSCEMQMQCCHLTENKAIGKVPMPSLTAAPMKQGAGSLPTLNAIISKTMHNSYSVLFPNINNENNIIHGVERNFSTESEN